MKTPKVSVVASAYNSELYIGRTIESILGQTFTDYEFILVDDASRDHTWEIIEQYASRDPRIIPLQNKVNLGVVGGLNRGLQAACGEYIARQDADDISLPDRFARQVEFLDANPEYGVVGSRINYIDSQDNPMDMLDPFQATENDEIQAKLLEYNCLCGPALMIRRKSLNEAGFWFGEGMDASEDYDICLRLAEVSKIASLPERHYLYRIHPQSASRTREFMQALHKANALENAIHRRFGPQPDVIRYKNVSRDYLWSSLLACLNGDRTAAHHWIEHAMHLYPPLLQKDEPVRTMIEYRTPNEVQGAITYFDSIFNDLLPQTPKIKSLYNNMISAVHMKEVFAGAAQGNQDRIRRNLWPGISHNPSWLLNYGVLVILVKNFLSH
jgi:glycosyltransferase involved in cell wall biosynthesis